MSVVKTSIATLLLAWVLWTQINDSANESWHIEDAFENLQPCVEAADKEAQKMFPKENRRKLNAGYMVVAHGEKKATIWKFLCLPAGTNPTGK